MLNNVGEKLTCRQKNDFMDFVCTKNTFNILGGVHQLNDFKHSIIFLSYTLW